MNINIRKAKEKDFESILTLIKELAEFEKSLHKVTNTVEQMISEKDFFECYVAELEYDSQAKEIIGIALYFFAYYTWVGKSLYLDDLYVKKEYRNLKIGKKLLQKIFETADKENCKRVRWQVLNWNKNTIGFYKSLQATLDKQWINCDFESSEKDFASLSFSLKN